MKKSVFYINLKYFFIFFWAVRSETKKKDKQREEISIQVLWFGYVFLFSLFSLECFIFECSKKIKHICFLFFISFLEKLENSRNFQKQKNTHFYEPFLRKKYELFPSPPVRTENVLFATVKGQ